MKTHIILVTVCSAIALGALLVLLRLKRYQLGRFVPGIWKKTYDINECPYGMGREPANIYISDDEKKLRKAVISRKAINNDRDDMYRKIPRLIIQTNEEDTIPEGMFLATGTILNKNPNYDYIYFNNIRARDYIKTHYTDDVLDAYDILIPGAYKADLFRYCVLYILGGIYIDMGMISLCCLDDIIGSDDTFLSPEDNNTSGIYNAFICCEPKNPIIGEAIKLSVQNIKNRDYTNSPLGITGPLLLSKAFYNILSQKVVNGKDYGDGVRILTHFKPDECMSGEIHGFPPPTNREKGTPKELRIISTRSPTYRRDQKWYNTKPRYTDLWNKKQVYLSQGF